MTTEKGDSINSSWNFGQNSNPETVAADGMQALWAFDDCAAFPLPMGRLLLKSRRIANTVIVTSEVFQALQLCRQFKLLKEHIVVVQEKIPALAGRQSEIAQIFRDLIQQGFMISARNLVLDLKRSEGIGSQAPFLGVFVRTCDRPKQLARLLRSFTENENRHGHRYRYVVMDDSREMENITENQRLTAQFKEENLEVYYYGKKEQGEFISTLINALPTCRELTEWLLGDNKKSALFSGGRLWNHMLLLGAGKRFLTIDDDMVCQPYLSPGHSYTFEVSSRQREVRFFFDREDMAAQISLSEIDPIQQHRDVLGCSLMGAINNFSAVEFNGLSFSHLSSDEVGALRAGSSLILTQSGVFGDPGTATTSWIYELEGEDRAQLVENHDAYIKRRASRCSWLGTSNFRFKSSTPLMGMMVGFDNQGMLPPTIPCFRNEDYLFGALVKFIIPDSFVFEFPWGLPHLPEPERSWSEQELDKPASVGLLAFLADVANNTAKHCYATEPVKRMALLAETYLALADADDSVLGAGIEENLIQAQAQKTNILHSCLEMHHNQPQYWADDIHRLLQANSQALIHKERELFSEDPSRTGRAQQVSMAKEVLVQFGKTLQVWPLLWEYCKKNLDNDDYFLH